MINPSLTRPIAAYRGPTDTEDYVNTFGEILHDIRYLMFNIDHNDNYADYRGLGQTDYINQNLRILWEGLTSATAYSTVPTNRDLYKSGNKVKSLTIQSINPTDSGYSIKTRLNEIEDGLRYITKNLK